MQLIEFIEGLSNPVKLVLAMTGMASYCISLLFILKYFRNPKITFEVAVIRIMLLRGFIKMEETITLKKRVVSLIAFLVFAPVSLYILSTIKLARNVN